MCMFYLANYRNFYRGELFELPLAIIAARIVCMGRTGSDGWLVSSCGSLLRARCVQLQPRCRSELLLRRRDACPPHYLRDGGGAR